jgi:hypothetical protein
LHVFESIAFSQIAALRSLDRIGHPYVIMSYIFGNEALLRVKHIHECTSDMEAGRLDKHCVSQHEVTSTSPIANTVDGAAHGRCGRSKRS